jgi:hypothetical protein
MPGWMRTVKFLIASALAYLDKNQSCAYGFRIAEKASKKDRKITISRGLWRNVLSEA